MSSSPRFVGQQQFGGGKKKKKKKKKHAAELLHLEFSLLWPSINCCFGTFFVLETACFVMLLFFVFFKVA